MQLLQVKLLVQLKLKKIIPKFFSPENANQLTLDFFLPEKYLNLAQGSVTQSMKEQLLERSGKKQQSSGGENKGAQIAQLFEVIKNNISPELVQSTQAVYVFKVKGLKNT